MTWVNTQAQEVSIADASVENDELWLGREDTERATGWQIKAEGLCRAEICIPVPAGREAEFRRQDQVNIAAFWRHMGRPVVRDGGGQAWMLGESAGDQGARLESLEAPDFALPDLAGQIHRLSDERGKKVFLATWASW